MTSDTRHCLLRRLLDPVGTFYRLLWTLDEDPVSNPRLGMKTHLRDLILSMPDRDYSRFKKEIDFLAKCPTDFLISTMFPYPRRLEGPSLDVGVDPKARLPYVRHNGKRLFFPSGTDKLEVERQYRCLTEEEGLLGTGCLGKSPHQYVSSCFQVEEGDVLLDIGSAEGVFALHYAELAKHLYLFEGLHEWKKPLEWTFAPYREKTSIVCRYVGNRSSRKEIRLEDALSSGKNDVFFLKMDIEGAEREVLGSCSDFLTSHTVKLSCCVYHRQDDATVIADMLHNLGFRTSLSDGYMLPVVNGVHYPYFRHGVIYARNDDGPLP